MQREPTSNDQLMLELINRARENPSQEADRLINGQLNEGVPQQKLITTTSKQPLAFNLQLNEGAYKHSQWMLENDVFSHTGKDNSTSQQRMANAGYDFTPPWMSGENIAWKGSTGEIDITQLVVDNYENLFIDEGYLGRGHRVTILQDEFQEIGIASVTGIFTSNDVDYNAVMTTQDFVYSEKNGAFLTGVVYTDAIENDDFYTVGEGVGDITIIAKQVGSNLEYQTQNWQSGGYTLYLPEGDYDISFIGNLDQDPSDDLVTTRVSIDRENIKLDLALDDTQLVNGNLPNLDPVDLEESDSLVNPNDSLLNQKIYRLQNLDQSGTYLYAGEQEKNNILRNYSQFSLEGLAFEVSFTPNDDLKAIYRLQNNDVPGTYLYTTAAESNDIMQNYDNFRNEGIAFYVYAAGGNNGDAIYRFQNVNFPSTYLFTGEQEKNNILNNYDNFQLEGNAFNVS